MLLGPRVNAMNLKRDGAVSEGSRMLETPREVRVQSSAGFARWPTLSLGSARLTSLFLPWQPLPSRPPECPAGPRKEEAQGSQYRHHPLRTRSARPKACT